MRATRPAAVAGMFYPADPQVLAQDIDRMLGEGRSGEAPGGGSPPAPKALIVPHAGYIYSGQVAASAYTRLAPLASTIRRVVLFGPCHRAFVRGLALPDCGRFVTPLGEVPIDEEGETAALRLAEVSQSSAAHLAEHSLEVQLPFLQRTLGSFKLLPFAVGAAKVERVAQVIDAFWNGPETLIVVSSDLSHYHPYWTASKIDRATVEQILEFSPWLDHEQACGATPINGLLMTARARGLRAELLDLRNSGDTAGDRNRVVGYAAFAFYEEAEAVEQKALQ